MTLEIDFKIGRFGLENRIILSWLHVAFTTG